MLQNFKKNCKETVLYTLTPAHRFLITPNWQGGIKASKHWFPTQVVTHVAVKARIPSREQVQYRYISEMRSLWQGATQPEDYTRIEECEVSEYYYNNIRLV